MQLSLEGLIELFNNWHGGVRYHILVRFTPATGTATTNGTDTLTVSAGYDLVVGNRLQFTGNPLPAPLAANTTYFVVGRPTTNQIKVSTTRNGQPLVVQPGQADYQELPLNGCDPLPVWVKHELTGYERVDFYYGAAVYDASRRAVTCSPVEVEHFGPLAYTHAATVRGGTGSVKNTDGTLEYWQDFGGLQTVAPDQVARFVITPRLVLVGSDFTGLNPC